MGKSLFSGKAYFLSRFHHHHFLEKILSLIPIEKPDIVQVEQLHCAFYGIQIKARFSLPVILRLHNIESVIVKRFGQQSMNPLARIYAFLEAFKIARYERSVCREFERVLTISKDDDNRIRSLQPDVRSSAIPSGVDTSFFSTWSGEEDPASILLLAAFHWRPNQDSFWWFVHDILPMIIQKIPNARVFVVGTNTPEQMKAFKHPNVTVVGEVDDVRPHIGRSCVPIVPLRVGGGIRLKLLELFSMGKAVVSTPVGCEGLTVENGKHLRVEETAQGFADAVVSLLESRPERQRLGKAARDLVVEHYSWDAVLQEYEKICLDLSTGS